MNSKIIPDKSHILMSDLLKEEIDLDEQLSSKMQKIINTVCHFTVDDKINTVVGLLLAYKIDKTSNNFFLLESKVEILDALQIVSEINSSISDVHVRLEIHKNEEVMCAGTFIVSSIELKMIDNQYEMCALSLSLTK
jgi:hypothetical protein